MLKLSRYSQYLFVIVLGIVSIIARYKYNGLILGFDYGIYQPDGKYYTYMSLDLLKNNPNESAKMVVDWYAAHGNKNNIFTVEDLIPSTSPVYSYISHRILYPLLSVPFVYLFGIPGMLIIPALAFLILLLSTQFVANKYGLIYIGFVACFALSTSPTVTRWMVVNCTDALLVGLFSYLTIVLTNMHKNQKYLYARLVPLIILTSATRFSFPFWFGISIILVVNNKKIIGIFTLLFSLLFSIPALASQLSVSILPANVSYNLLEKIMYLPVSFAKVILVDIAQLIVLDRLFLLFIFCGTVLSLIHIRNVPSQYFLAMLLAGYFLGAINGTLGVNFRYQMPAIPFCAWAIISSLPKNLNRSSISIFLRSHIKV
jgi:hypothetical protein